jgi:hypothetical protein
MSHAWIVVLFESTPELSDNLGTTVTETFETFRRTFLTKSLSVAVLLKLQFNGTTVEECEKNLDTLFYTHDYDVSKSISKKEYARLKSDFIRVCNEFEHKRNMQSSVDPTLFDFNILRSQSLTFEL